MRILEAMSALDFSTGEALYTMRVQHGDVSSIVEIGEQGFRQLQGFFSQQGTPSVSDIVSAEPAREEQSDVGMFPEPVGETKKLKGKVSDYKDPDGIPTI